MYVSLELKKEKRNTHLFANKFVLLSGPLAYKFIGFVLPKNKEKKKILLN